MPAKRIIATAYHEAGHAVAARILGARVDKVSIVPDENYSGHVLHENLLRGLNLECDNSNRVRLRIERKVKISLAGPEAQRHFSSRSWQHYHGQRDHENVIDFLSCVTRSDEELRAYCRLLEIQTRQLVTQPFIWSQIGSLAEKLLKAKVLTGKQVKEFLKECRHMRLEHKVEEKNK